MGDNGKHPHQEFKIRASDDRGHAERVQLRMPPQMLSKVQKAVNSKIWPYDDYQELMRHAILRHLGFLEKDSPEVGNLTAQIESMNLMLEEEMEYQRMEQMYTKMQAVFRKNLSMSDDTARSRNLKLVLDMWQRISNIDDPYWREMWQKKFRKEYDEVLKAAPEIEFGDMVEGDMGWD